MGPCGPNGRGGTPDEVSGWDSLLASDSATAATMGSGHLRGVAVLLPKTTAAIKAEVNLKIGLTSFGPGAPA